MTHPLHADEPLVLPRVVVAATGISKRFGRLPVLRSVDLTIRAGRVTAILGPNGAGKSTFIKVLLGLTRADAGSLSVNGQAVGSDPRYREGLGYMPQLARFPENLTGREVVRLLRDLRGPTRCPRTTSCSTRSGSGSSWTSRSAPSRAAPGRSSTRRWPSCSARPS